MRIMFAFFTGLYGKALSLGVKLLASGATLVTGLFTRLGVKLLSYGWIEKPFNVIKKALSIVKQVVFNQKVVVILKYLLAMGLCVVALIQLFFAGRTVYENIDTVIALAKMPEFFKTIALSVGGIVILLIVITKYKKQRKSEKVLKQQAENIIMNEQRIVLLKNELAELKVKYKKLMKIYKFYKRHTRLSERGIAKLRTKFDSVYNCLE